MMNFFKKTPDRSHTQTAWDDYSAINELLSDCAICPRNCHVDRLHGQVGFCGEGGELRAARAALYYTEEPVISGKNGSGTVFFTGCNLGCIYCQNRQISRPAGSTPAPSDPPANSGRSDVRPLPRREHTNRQNETRKTTNQQPAEREAPNVQNTLPCLTKLSPERLSEIFFELEAQGAHNINLVTPEHFVPLIIPALKRAKNEGLSIPIVYNTGSYEKVDAVKALEGLVDVWLPDLKYVSSALSSRHTGAADYFARASAAIAEMVRQCPDPVFSDGTHAIDCPDDADDPLLVRGVLVRHLALPGCGDDSRAVLRYLHETYGNHIFISIMNQYTPMPQVLARKLTGLGRSEGKRPKNSLPEDTSYSCPGGISDLCRTLSAEEYDSLVDYAIDLGIENGFVQECGTVSPSYIPAFDGTGIRTAALQHQKSCCRT